uniref:Uncharacterized protein n=1 Tax=Anguilla anguilla TaxID=7936 RepID=A0A0E9WTZ2_ANGAN
MYCMTNPLIPYSFYNGVICSVVPLRKCVCLFVNTMHFILV